MITTNHKQSHVLLLNFKSCSYGMFIIDPLLFNLDMRLFAYSTLFIWGCDMLIGHHSLVD